MQLTDGLQHAFDEIREGVTTVAHELDPRHLVWRPDRESNSIAWLLWHLTRVQDNHVAEIIDTDQVWFEENWAPSFGLAQRYDDTGYGHTAEKVAAIRPDTPQIITTYHDHVCEQTRQYLAEAADDDLERIIDRSYDPPVSVGVRLLSVVGDDFQHVGQAAYLRGLAERNHA